MPDLILRGVDPAQLRADIAADVVSALLPHLTDSMTKPKNREEMAEWLSVSLPTLDRMTRNGEVPSSMLRGRRVYIPERVIAALPNAKGKAHE